MKLNSQTNYLFFIAYQFIFYIENQQLCFKIFIKFTRKFEFDANYLSENLMKSTGVHQIKQLFTENAAQKCRLLYLDTVLSLDLIFFYFSYCRRPSGFYIPKAARGMLNMLSISSIQRSNPSNSVIHHMNEFKAPSCH